MATEDFKKSLLLFIPFLLFLSSFCCDSVVFIWAQSPPHNHHLSKCGKRKLWSCKFISVLSLVEPCYVNNFTYSTEHSEVRGVLHSWNNHPLVFTWKKQLEKERFGEKLIAWVSYNRLLTKEGGYHDKKEIIFSGNFVARAREVL